ncbi:MAG: apolipoprotein N-acyltransferase [Pseudomonadales bacterium]|nr:apolipoprotein N-acyltransferase [Pseudomonadales bacterium]
MPAPDSKPGRALLAMLAGGLAPLSLSPLDFWPAAILSIMAFMALLQNTSPRHGSFIGWAYGCGFFGVGASWVYVSIHVYGDAGPLLAGLLTLLFVMGLALFFSLQAWVLQHFFSQTTSLWVFPAVWVIFEGFRGWVLTGFPWLYLGYAHLDTPLAGWAPVFGVMGISFVVVLSAVILYRLLLLFNASSKAPYAPTLIASITLLAGLWLVPLLLNSIVWVKEVPEKSSTVALVQANIAQEIKFDRAHLQAGLDRYAALSAPLWATNQIVLWPETAIPLLYQQAGEILQSMSRQANIHHSALISGILFRDGQLIHNSIISIGKGESIYHKQKLVPFGEYVPLAGIVENLLQIFDLPMSSLSPGPAGQPLLKVGELGLAPFICYEVVYPDFVRKAAATSDFLVTISNDTWFGNSLGPLQHLQMAAMRALENGRYLVRATNNGVSAIIDEKGHILARTPQFQEAVLSARVKVFAGTTPFSRWGSTPVLIFSFLILVFQRLRRL